ncbi:hypothetical protein [Amphibacillus jilinensis]|uniref:hypothetical protein n=1 Tax=Amphibacillus jilinensis TaxID=1216008 RepID=UPI00031B10B3|nr:hypothetical protein [Amphibacillus jilinensis]
MKKFLFLILSLFVVLGLTACEKSEAEEKDIRSTEEKNIGSVETSAEQKGIGSVETSSKDFEVADSGNDEDETTEDAESDSKEFNQVIADTDHIKATLVSIEKVTDASWAGDAYNVNIEIENKREDTIRIRASEVSADGRMIDDMAFLSDTVAGGKILDATLKIQNYDGDLPVMEENLEFILSVSSADHFDFRDDTNVIIDFNTKKLDL